MTEEFVSSAEIRDEMRQEIDAIRAQVKQLTKERDDLKDAQQDTTFVSAGVAAIAAERKRQIEVEGWKPEHDDNYVDGDLCRAAACYSIYAGGDSIFREEVKGILPDFWPWHPDWWKPSEGNTPKARIRELEKSGALIAAEIDRLKRAELKGGDA